MIEALCDWLSATRVSNAFQAATWFVPLVQTVHILSIGLLVIAIAQLAKSLLERDQPSAHRVMVQSARRMWWLLLVLLITGVLLIITEPARELLNWVFRLKMILVAALALMVLGVVYRGRPNNRRLVALYSGVLIVITVAIITAGRWIAYI